MTSRLNPRCPKRTVCFQCHTRKVRCDGQTNTCGPCQRLGFHCSFRGGPGSESVPVPRHRGQHACTACKRRKVRCSGALPKCSRCQQKRVECFYPTRLAVADGGSARSPADSGVAQPLDTMPGGHSPPGEEASRGMAGSDQAALVRGGADEPEPRGSRPPDEMIERALTLFFERLACNPVFSFLHKASVMKQYHEGALDDILILAITGITSLMCDVDAETKGAGSRNMDAAATSILCSIDTPTIAKVQALVFVIKHRVMTRRFSAAFMLTAVAMRFATGLRLNYEDAQVPFLARENCRRIMWSLYMIDTAFNAGYQDFTLCRPDMLHIQLPCDENDFQLDMPPHVSERLVSHQPLSSSACPISAQAMTIRAFWLRHRALELTKQALRSQGPDIYSQVEALQDDFDMYTSRLASSYQLSNYNTHLHVYSPTLPAYITMHIVRNDAHCILYRLALTGLKESLPSHVADSLDPAVRADWERRCCENAEAIVDFCQTLLSAIRTNQQPVLDFDLAIAVYHAVRILTWMAQAKKPHLMPRHELDPRLGTCRAFLDRMFCHCEAVDAIRRDITTLSTIVSGHHDDHDAAEVQHLQDHSRHGEHILSQHGLVGQMKLPSKIQSFPLSQTAPEEARASAERPPSTTSSGNPGPTTSTSTDELLPFVDLHAARDSTVADASYVDAFEQSLLGFTVSDSWMQSSDWLLRGP